MNRNLKLGIGLIVGAVAVLLIFNNIQASMIWTVPVEEVIYKEGKDGDYVGQTIYLLGQVVPNSIEQKTGTLEYRLEVMPKILRNGDEPALCRESKGAEQIPCRDLLPEGKSLTVYHKGTAPDTMWLKDDKGYGAEVNITGSLGEDGVFHSTKILAKCPSKYEESDAKVPSRPQAAQ